MLPRIVLCAVVSFLTVSPLMAQFKPAKKPVESQSAKQLHNSVLIIDTHADTTQRLANPPAGDQGNFDFAKAKTGNLGAEFFSIWVEPKEF